MQRISFLLKVKEDKIDEYNAHHAAVWPEMLDALSRHGWHNYSLFMRPDGLLFGYFETPDYDAARAGMSKEEVNARWQAMMAPFFERAPFFEGLGATHADEMLVELEEVFHLD